MSVNARCALVCGLFAGCATSTQSVSPAQPQGEITKVVTAPVQQAKRTMTLKRLGAVLRKIDPGVSSPRPGVWELQFQGVRLTCLAQQDADRMRIITPITRLKDVTPKQLFRAMEANFHTALDARYATARGLLFSAFIHPLGALDEKALQSAVYQVASLAVTFGSEYTSGVMRFGKPGQRI